MNPEPTVTLDDLCALGSEHLPEGWELRLRFTEGCIDLSLLDPEGVSVERCHDDMNLVEMILDYVNHARESDGLGPVGVHGEYDPEV